MKAMGVGARLTTPEGVAYKRASPFKRAAEAGYKTMGLGGTL